MDYKIGDGKEVIEAGDLTVTADVAVAAPAVAVRTVLAASAFFAERIPTDATALGT